MADYEANFTLEPQPTIEADFAIEISNNDHNLLVNRDLSDQHPISAITGLQDALNTIPTDYVSDAELEAALLEKQDVIRDLSEIRQGAILGATAVQPSELESYATTDYVDDGLSEKQDTLTAGANIQIVGNTISATDTTYTAGTGISIVGNVISNTQTSAEWGNITGTLSAQTDLQNALNLKANTADLATVATTGNYSDLSGTPTIPTVNNATLTIQKNSTNVATFTANASSDVTANISVPTDTSDLTNNAGYITSSALSGYATETWVGQQGYITNSALSGYATESYVNSADNNLQSQIDAITSASDVTDIVGTYAQLQAYDTTSLPNNSIIKVLQDESRDDEITYYRWVITGGVGAWVLIGEEGPYYTKSQANSTFVPQTRTVNNKALSSNISLTASDVGALPDSTVIPTVNDAILTIQKNGTTVSTFTANASSNVTANITVPTDNNQLTNGAGYITGISSSDVTTALGYTPYNSSNPSGFITASALTPYVLSTDLATVATSGSYNDLSNKPTIPTVNNATLTITQGGTTKGTFTANAGSDVTIALDAGGGGGSYTAGTGIDITNDVISVDGVTTSEITLAAVATSGNYSDLSNKPDLTGYQTTANLVTSVSSSSTDNQYPSAKLFYDTVGDIESAINAIRGV